MTDNTFPAGRPQFDQNRSMPDSMDTTIVPGTVVPDAATQGQTLTDAEREQVRQGVFGALAYVSQADPGFFSTFTESAAGARVLAGAPDSVKQLLAGGMVMPQAKSAEEFKASALPNLHQAVQIVAAKDPQAAQALKQVILEAVQAVASASKGVSATEQQAIAGIQQALV